MSKFLAGLVTGIVITMAFVSLQNRYWTDDNSSATTTVADTMVEDTTVTSQGGDLPHDFVLFYDQFHSDSAFQLEHILFPLEGLPPDADSLLAREGGFRWQKSDWKLHQHFNSMDGNFTQQFIPLGEAMVVEQIRHREAAYGMQRRFAKLGDDWQLIYYGAMNRLAE